MDKEKFYIDMPDDDTIKNQIDIILDKGLKPRESFFTYMKNMYKQIRLRYLFHDLVEIIFTVLVCLCIFTVIILGQEGSSVIKINRLYAFIMITSPILYLILSLISFVNSKQRGTYEIEMSCKYNLYNLAGFRMLVFSILSILFNVGVIGLIIFKYKEINFLRACMISITSLFLFSSLFLYLILIINSKMTKYLVIIGWISVNLLLFLLNTNFYVSTLISLPIAVYITVTLLSVYFYIKKLKEFIKFTSIEGVF